MEMNSLPNDLKSFVMAIESPSALALFNDEYRSLEEYRRILTLHEQNLVQQQ